MLHFSKSDEETNLVWDELKVSKLSADFHFWENCSLKTNLLKGKTQLFLTISSTEIVAHEFKPVTDATKNT